MRGNREALHAGNLLLGHHCIISAFGFALAVDGEVRHSLQIADDACEIVYILALAVRTHRQALSLEVPSLRELTLVDVSAAVAERVGDIECEIIAALLCGNAEEMTILRL